MCLSQFTVGHCFRELIVWDIDTLERIRTIGHTHRPLEAFALTADLNIALVGFRGEGVFELNLETEEVGHMLMPLREYVQSIDIATEGLLDLYEFDFAFSRLHCVNRPGQQAGGHETCGYEIACCHPGAYLTAIVLADVELENV
jgi:hypothetical protein